MIRNLVDCEHSYINTDHPNFIGGSCAIAQARLCSRDTKPCLGLPIERRHIPADTRHARGHPRCMLVKEHSECAVSPCRSWSGGTLQQRMQRSLHQMAVPGRIPGGCWVRFCAQRGDLLFCHSRPALRQVMWCNPHLSALLRAGHGGTESGHSHSLPNMRTFGGGPAGDGPGHGKSTLAAKVLAGQSCRRDLTTWQGCAVMGHTLAPPGLQGCPARALGLLDRRPRGSRCTRTRCMWWSRSCLRRRTCWRRAQPPCSATAGRPLPVPRLGPPHSSSSSRRRARTGGLPTGLAPRAAARGQRSTAASPRCESRPSCAPPRCWPCPWIWHCCIDPWCCASAWCPAAATPRCCVTVLSVRTASPGQGACYAWRRAEQRAGVPGGMRRCCACRRA